MELGKRLRELRQGAKMALLDVKKKTGISVSHLSDIERGRARPSLETLTALAQCYGISMVDLMEGIDSTPKLVDIAGLRELVEKGQIPRDWAGLLSRIEWRGKRPQDERQWMMLYTFLQSLLGNGKGKENS